MKRIAPIILLSVFLFACGTTKKATEATSPATPEAAPDKSARVKDGADFRASGNEPFWSLDIDFQGSMHYISAEGHEFTVPAVKGEHAMDANVTRYHSETEKGTLTVQVFKQPCVNSMSGEKSNFRVQIELKKRGDEKTQTLTGCGNYIDAYAVNDVWTLESIGDKKIQPAAGNTAITPTLEIRINEGKVLGMGGCNRYSGNFKMEGETMTFGPLMSTKMACENMATENQFMNALSVQPLPYKLTGDTLVLGTGASMLTFKRGK